MRWPRLLALALGGCAKPASNSVDNVEIITRWFGGNNAVIKAETQTTLP